MKKIIMSLSLLSFSALGTLYTEREIAEFHSHKAINTLSTTVLTSSDPNHTLALWMKNQHNDLEKEQQLYDLLNQLAIMPPEPLLSPIIQKLTQYQAQAVRVHPEARHPDQATEAIFNISSKAAGVQNIWLMKTVQQKTAQIISRSQQPLTDIEQLINSYNNKNAAALGIKTALQAANENDLKHLKNVFTQQSNINKSLYSTLTDLTNTKADLDFASWAVSQVDKNHAERIYRQSSQKFSADYTIQLITQDSNSHANPAFVTSLLSKFSDHPQVITFALKQLTKPQASSGAAYVLSKSRDLKIWLQMEQIYLNTDSEQIKNNIIFSLKNNKLPETQSILDKLNHDNGAKS